MPLAWVSGETCIVQFKAPECSYVTIGTRTVEWNGQEELWGLVNSQVPSSNWTEMLRSKDETYQLNLLSARSTVLDSNFHSHVDTPQCLEGVTVKRVSADFEMFPSWFDRFPTASVTWFIDTTIESSEFLTGKLSSRSSGLHDWIGIRGGTAFTQCAVAVCTIRFLPAAGLLCRCWLLWSVRVQANGV